MPTFEASVGVLGWTLLIDAALALDGRRFQQHVVAAPRGKVIDHIEIKRSSGMGALSRRDRRHHARFEMAFSNLFNVENLDVPNTNVTSGAFGRVTATQCVDQAGPRTIQFSLR